VFVLIMAHVSVIQSRVDGEGSQNAQSEIRALRRRGEVRIGMVVAF
jgi:hypothetical protein